MDKSNNIVTFVYKSSKKSVFPLFAFLGFIVILVMTVIAIFHRDFFMGLFAAGSFIMYIVILIYISADEYLIFNKKERMVYNHKVAASATACQFCDFDSIDEVRIVREKNLTEKFYSQIVIGETIMNSSMNIIIGGIVFDRSRLFKDLIVEAMKVSEITGCPFIYDNNLPPYAEDFIKNYKEEIRGMGYNDVPPPPGSSGQYEDEHFWNREKNLPHPLWWEGEGTFLEEKHSFGYAERIISLIALPDGEKAIIGTQSGKIYIISLETGKMERKIISPLELSYLLLHPDGTLLIGKENYHSTVHVWNLKTAEKLYAFASGGAFKGLYIYPERERIKILKKHGELTWNLYTGALLNESEGELMHEDGYDFMASHPEKNIHMEGQPGYLRISGTYNTSERFTGSYNVNKEYSFEQIAPLYYYYDGCDFLAKAHMNRVMVWDLDKKKKHVLEGHSEEVISVSIHHPLVTTGSQDKALKLWNLETEKCIAAWQAESAVIASAISPSGHIIYATDKWKVGILEIKNTG